LDIHAQSCTLAVLSKSRGKKSDKADAYQRAEELLRGTAERRVFKSPQTPPLYYAYPSIVASLSTRLACLAGVHGMSLQERPSAEWPRACPATRAVVLTLGLSLERWLRGHGRVESSSTAGTDR
jgi:hypothetical protein